MTEPTEEDRLRWATYAVNEGYAEWSDTPGRTTANTEAYFALFRILEREHRHKATEGADDEATRLRDALADVVEPIASEECAHDQRCHGLATADWPTGHHPECAMAVGIALLASPKDETEEKNSG